LRCCAASRLRPPFAVASQRGPARAIALCTILSVTAKAADRRFTPVSESGVKFLRSHRPELTATEAADLAEGAEIMRRGIAAPTPEQPAADSVQETLWSAARYTRTGRNGAREMEPASIATSIPNLVGRLVGCRPQAV
jgi:hypothetical protein